MHSAVVRFIQKKILITFLFRNIRIFFQFCRPLPYSVPLPPARFSPHSLPLHDGLPLDKDACSDLALEASNSCVL